MITKGRKTNQKLTAIIEALKKVTWERVFIGDILSYHIEIRDRLNVREEEKK